MKIGNIEKDLVLQSNGRYFDWIKGFQKGASALGLLGFFGIGGGVDVYRPTVHADISDTVRRGDHLNSKDTVVWNQYNTQIQEYERNCGKALTLVEAYVSRDVFEKIQTQVRDWDTPNHERLRAIITFLRKTFGGTYEPYRDSENRRAIDIFHTLRIMQAR